MTGRLTKGFRLATGLVRSWLRSATADPIEWLHDSASACARALDLKITVTGPLPDRGLIVANHLGYLDIVALASVLPCRFVAKKDVAAWPVFGAFAKRGGTVFIDRLQRADVVRANSVLVEALLQPGCTVIFPEGTSSDGTSVLPFHSSLLEPAILAGCPVTPLRISYESDDANPGQAMAYHSDMTLVPHLWNLLRLRHLRVYLTFGVPRQLEPSRKAAAGALREEIGGLAG